MMTEMTMPYEASRMPSPILAVDDDRTVLHLIKQGLESLHLPILSAATSEEAFHLVVREQPDVMLLDVMLPDASGLEVFKRVREFDRRLPVIFITSGTDSDTAIEAMRLGGYDYVLKPLDLRSLKALVERALETRRLMSVPVALPTVDEETISGVMFIGRSPQMMDVFKAIGRVAQQHVTVLIRGESGTGKELVARALYQHSGRAEHPFMEVNCAAIPENLLESELFGHEKGSFTGADRRRIGKFEQCNGGTIFLDEVGDMSPLVQGKVLRLLQEQRFERVGGNETIQTDVRIIAATNRPLEAMVEDGQFRADLFYRLNGVSIHLPPLRERGEDVALLLQHFLTRATRELNKPEIEGLSPDALAQLTAYAWPGNVREVQSVMRQAVLSATGTVIVPEFLPPEVRGGEASRSAAGKSLPPSDLLRFIETRLHANSTDLYAECLAFMERVLITRVLQETGGNQSKAAEVLGITRGKVRDRISAFNISLDKSVSVGPNRSS
jgi:two-component system nitrogen regulation response regulator GlnG